MDVEEWMRRTGYKGRYTTPVLKNLEDYNTMPLRFGKLIWTAIKGILAYYRGGVEGFKTSMVKQQE